MLVSDIRNTFIDKLKNSDTVKDKSGCNMLEIIGSSFTADEPSIFGELNEDYIKREINWYKSMSLFVQDIAGKTPKIWESVSGDAPGMEGLINSNYGWCVFSNHTNVNEKCLNSHNHNQFDRVLKLLEKDRNSRQAIMIYTRPTMHLDSKAYGMSDFMCTNTVAYFIRDDILHCVVNMRSNDVVFGYRNDYAWQMYVAHILKLQLDCKDIKVTWQAASLHIYERDFWRVWSWKKFNKNISKAEWNAYLATNDADWDRIGEE